MRAAAPLAAAALLLGATAAPARVVEATWTDAAKQMFAQRMQKGGQSTQLPEVRAFDADGNPILRIMPAGPSTIAELRRVQAGAPPIAGATLDQVLSAFQLRDGGGAVQPAVGTPRLVVVDFWAEWCVPCKAVSRDLERWLAGQPDGSVTLIRAETDLVEALRTP